MKKLKKKLNISTTALFTTACEYCSLDPKGGATDYSSKPTIVMMKML